jgi:hypothetical protein
MIASGACLVGASLCAVCRTERPTERHAPRRLRDREDAGNRCSYRARRRCDRANSTSLSLGSGEALTFECLSWGLLPRGSLHIMCGGTRDHS